MKRCKGAGKAKGYGCSTKLPFTNKNGFRSYKATYGLGYNCRCYQKWLYKSSEGLKTVSKAGVQGKKIEASKYRRSVKERVAKNRSKSWHDKELQRVINRIVREIDKGHKCISSGRKLNNKYDAGHYYSVGSNPSLRYNLHNIFAQSVSDNQYNGGNPIEYIANVSLLFGEDYADEMQGMRQKYKVIKLSIPEIKIAKAKAKKFLTVILGYKAGNKHYRFTIEERISLRREGNFWIGIYK